MGAGFAELLLDGKRGGGQIVPHPGRGVCASAEFEPQTRNFDASGGAKSGDQTRPGSQAHAGVVSVSAGERTSLITRTPHPGPLPVEGRGGQHSTARYRIVKLANGSYSIHSLAHRETFHPVIGPVAEAEALYVRQLNLPDRLRNHRGEFVVWDV